MELVIKSFAELTKEELYEILRVRAEVFAAWQRCAYQDIDGLDCESVHMYLTDGGKIAAYLRFFRRAGEPEVYQIGRVLTVRRGEGLGGKLLREAVREIRSRGAEGIYLEAQVYARGFYEREGFRAVTDEFDEDGIPHIGMRLTL